MDRLKPFGGTEKLFGFQNKEANNAWLAAIVNSSNDAIISKTLDGNVTSWNPAAERVFGYTEAEMLHVSIRRIVPANRQEEEDQILEAIRAGKSVPRFETVRLHKDGHDIPISVTVSPIFDDAGHVVGASKIARDITEYIQAQKQIRDSESRFATLADNMSQLAWMANREGLIFWYNKRWYDYTGTTLEDMHGWGWKSVHHPDHVERVVNRIQHSWTTGEDWEDLFPLRGVNGEYRWFLSRAKPIRDEDGQIIRWFGTNTDVTEQRDREEQIRFLMRELAHRSKNMLALVQGIARQTIPKEHRTFLTSFNDRIQALSASQDLLTQTGWKGTSISELIASQLGHIGDTVGNRIRLRGEDVRIDAGCSQTLGMALHELATNAVKYGALSNESGVVDVEWSLVATLPEEPQAFSIRWQESGGPPVVQPERRGFGSTVIERMARSAFAGEVSLQYLETGLVWTLKGAPGRGLEGEAAE